MEDEFNVYKSQIEKTIIEKRDNKNIRRYEVRRTEHGWHVIFMHYNVEHPWPEQRDMWIPDEVMDQIILPLTAKEKLDPPQE